jgi:hypothetical protein
MERYTIRLLIVHPDISAEEIDNRVGLTARHFWSQGEPRRTPNGRQLGGFRTETTWCHVTRTQGRRHFFAGVRDLVRHLQPRHRFLTQWTAGGGHLSLTINLPGDVNMGDDLEPETLRLMSDLGIGLGVEVFPKMK